MVIKLFQVGKQTLEKAGQFLGKEEATFNNNMKNNVLGQESISST